MKRERAKELLEAFTAFAEGEAIETRREGDDGWVETDEAYWGNYYEYRIKPEPPLKVNALIDDEDNLVSAYLIRGDKTISSLHGDASEPLRELNLVEVEDE